MFPGLTTKLSEGASVASATTVTLPRADIIQITGTTNIATLVGQFGGGFSGVIWVWCSDGAVTFTGGNILAARTVPQNLLVPIVFSKAQQKWIVGAIS